MKTFLILFVLLITQIGVNLAYAGIRDAKAIADFMEQYSPPDLIRYQKLVKEDPKELLVEHANFAIKYVNNLILDLPTFLSFNPDEKDLLRFVNLPSRLGRGQLHESWVGPSYEVISDFYPKFFKLIRSYNLTAEQFAVILNFYVLPASEWGHARAAVINDREITLDLMMKYPSRALLNELSKNRIGVGMMFFKLARLRESNQHTNYEVSDILSLAKEGDDGDRKRLAQVLERELDGRGEIMVALSSEELALLRELLIINRSTDYFSRLSSRISGKYGEIRLKKVIANQYKILKNNYSALSAPSCMGLFQR